MYVVVLRGYMAGKDWQITVDFKTEGRVAEESIFDLIEEFADYGAAAALKPDELGGSLTICVTAGSAIEAWSAALPKFSDSRILSNAEISAFEVAALGD